MREFCLSEELLQSYFDGELSPETMERAAAHIAACVDCARLSLEVENENLILSAAFEPEMSLSIPTMNLRERIDVAISELEPQRQVQIEFESERDARSRLRDLFNSLASAFTPNPQRAYGLAGLAAVLVFAAIFAVVQLRQSAPESRVTDGGMIAKVRSYPATTSGTSDVVPPVSSTEPDQKGGTTQIPKDQNLRVGSKPKDSSSPKQAQRPDRAVEQPEATQPKLLPGERSYLEAIASLTTAIEESGEVARKPALQSEYQRNLAVVDQAIAATRSEAQKYPKDPYAAEFLYAAYRNKIEMLNTVAGQTQLASR